MVLSANSIVALGHRPDQFAKRSGMLLLAEALEAEELCWPVAWEQLSKKSWRAGELLRKAAARYYGSEWSAYIPFYSDKQLANALACRDAETLLVLWGEFFTPRNQHDFKRYKKIGCFHATQWRQPQVIGAFRNFNFYDAIVIMSESQRPFIEARGYPSNKIHTILHGVDTHYWKPGNEHKVSDGPIRGLIVGGTERDHAFLAKLLKALPEGVIQVSACIPKAQQVNYEGAPFIEFLPRLNDEELKAAYQDAELMILPMIDCTANNALLESMACATPAIINNVGGVLEYATQETSFILDGKDVERWRARLKMLLGQKYLLVDAAKASRRRAEELDWAVIGRQYQALIDRV